METKRQVDDLIADALRAEDLSDLESLGEPGLPEMVTEIFRGRLRWYGAMFLVMILVFASLAVLCAVQFLSVDTVPGMLRWGIGLLLCTLVVTSGKNWYWMQMERVAMTREIKRVELLVVQLATEIRSQR